MYKVVTTKNYAKFTKEIRTDWVQSLTVEFLKELEAKPYIEIEQYCKDKLDEFSSKCQEKSSKLDGDSWKSSAVSYLTGIRKAIKSWQESIELNPENSYEHKNKEDIIIRDHKALLYMNYGRNFLSEVKAKSDSKKQEQRRNLVPINNVDEIQNAIEKACLSSNWNELATGIEFALGARIGEVLLTAEIEQLNQFQVIFKGQIKTKDEDRLEYPKYTLIESWKVVDALLKLRRMTENKEIRHCLLTEVDSRQNASVNRKVRELFGDLLQPPHGVERISSHNLRSAHAAIAFYLFGSHTQSFGSFIKDNLGHKGDGEAANYEDYYVADLDGKPVVQGAWLDRLKEKPCEPTQTIIQPRIRVTKADKELIDNQEFLPFPDQVSRIEELIRLAKIGKQFEEGKLVKEIVTVVEKPVEKIVEVPIEKVVEKMVETPVEKITEKVVELSTISEKVIEPSTISSEKKQIKAKDVSELANSQLFGSNTPYSGFEKVRRAVDAVKAYNERQYSKDTMWAINTKVLSDLTGCRSAILKNFLESPEGRLTVTDYNLEKGLSYHHNKGRGSVTEVIKLEGIQDTSVINTPTATPIIQPSPKSQNKTITLKATEASLMDIEHKLKENRGCTVTTKDRGKVVAVYKLNEADEVVKI